MDIVKVHYDEELQGVYGDDCRYLFDVSEKKLGEEVVKRINMHDELVSAMRNMFDMLSINCQCNSYSREQLKKYLEAEKLLERCK